MVDLLRQKKASKRLEEISDGRAQRLVEVAWSSMFSRFMERRDLPSADFDAEFFVSVLEEAFSDEATMKQVLHGDPADDW